MRSSIKQRFYHVGFRPFDFVSDNIVTLKRKRFLSFTFAVVVGLLDRERNSDFLEGSWLPSGAKGSTNAFSDSLLINTGS